LKIIPGPTRMIRKMPAEQLEYRFLAWRKVTITRFIVALPISIPMCSHDVYRTVENKRF